MIARTNPDAPEDSASRHMLAGFSVCKVPHAQTDRDTNSSTTIAAIVDAATEPEQLSKTLPSEWTVCIYRHVRPPSRQTFFGVSIGPADSNSPIPVYDSTSGYGLRLLKENSAVCFTTRTDGLITLRFRNKLEWDVFARALQNLQSFDRVLVSLRGLARDMLFAGAYSVIPETADVILPELVKEGLEILARISPEESRQITKKRARVDVYEEPHVFGRACVYCECTDELLQHPYVPSDFQGKPVEMCETCITNWKAHRHKIESEGGLVPKNEANEEICAVCSAIPSDLVLCGSCPRSYCPTCLQTILSTAEYGRMQKVDDWACMVCYSENKGKSDDPARLQLKRRHTGGMATREPSQPILAHEALPQEMLSLPRRKLPQSEQPTALA